MQLLEIKEKAKKAIQSIKCDYAELRLAAANGTSIVLSGDDIDLITSGNSIGGSIRVLNKGAWGFVTFNDLVDLESFVQRGLNITKYIQHNDQVNIYRSDPIELRYTTKCVKNFRNISVDQKVETMQNYNNILKSSELIQTTRTNYRDTDSTYIYLNTDGSDVEYNKSFCGIGLAAYAKDGAVIQPFQNSIAGYGGFELVEGKEGLAEETKKIALDLLKAESVPGGNYDIIVDTKLSGVFIHEAFGHLSEADFVHENERMQKVMLLGKQFGPPELNVIDDGNIESLPGFIPVDDEGVLPRKTELIKNGKLNARLHSRETASKMNEAISGNARAMSVMKQPIVRMTNTYIENGTCQTNDLFDSLENGIYAIDVIGGQTNLEMFTFTSGYGYEIKNGKKGKMFKDIVLSGNVFNTLNTIKMISNDRQMYGGLGGCGKGGQGPLPVSFGGPHMLINNVLIGGAQ